MMSEHIILKNKPKIEFQLLNNGFQLIDEQTHQNSGFYAYSDFKSIELNKLWFPRLSKWLRGLTWILNMGVPYFPDAESYKKANLIIHFKNSKLGIWLTNPQMSDRAIMLKALLDKKIKQDQESY